MDQSSSLGCPHVIPSKYQEPSRVKAWGCPRHPLILIDYHKVVFVELRFYHFTYYVLCLEHLFTFSLFFAGHIFVWILSLFVWERDMLRFFSFASLISCWVFLATVCFSSKLSLLAFILFRAASCFVKLSCSSLILVGELLLKNCLNCQCDKMMFVWW